MVAKKLWRDQRRTNTIYLTKNYTVYMREHCPWIHGHIQEITCFAKKSTANIYIMAAYIITKDKNFSHLEFSSHQNLLKQGLECIPDHTRHEGKKTTLTKKT